MPISKRECAKIAQGHSELVEANAAKRAKGASGGGEKTATADQTADGPTEAGELRTFQIGLLGRSFEVSLPAASSVGDLLQKIGEEPKMRPDFYICGDGGKILDDPSAALPPVSQLACFFENPSPLCPAALKVFRSAKPGPGNGTPEDLQRLQLGRCRTLGSFPTTLARAKKDPRLPEPTGNGDFNILEMLEYPEDYGEYTGKYQVVEMALIDGSGQLCRLLGVINTGHAEDEELTLTTGLKTCVGISPWGSIFLRPSFQEVGSLNGESDADTESRWDIKDASWYTPHSSPLPRNDNCLMGGASNMSGKHAAPLETHLAHALETAFRNMEQKDDEEEDDVDEEPDEEFFRLQASSVEKDSLPWHWGQYCAKFYPLEIETFERIAEVLRRVCPHAFFFQPNRPHQMLILC
eukprot:gnl/TRDRNA2_/TRDRNA2_187258_c0_seq1.p1 gnl/TRDRNA2_/TRDRNA2_187258_c0~~gnl/TRDRNA2_/TRDRNA2_187258_c0_seq1.p1  ORF type:complete len:409 (+),score=66.65 gnl/TRDRNA2_/TRDRNA2_187258_c0_seq1:91-1317(+)